jgi:Transposase DDE domain
MAGPARLLSPLAHRPPPLRPLGRQRHPGTAARGAARSGTRGRRPRGHADRRGDRLAVGAGQPLGLAGDQGYDAAKKVHGRKRHVAVDPGGLLLDILVTRPAPRTATAAGGCCGASAATPDPRLVWADAGYAGKLVTWAQQALTLTLQIVRKRQGVHHTLSLAA